MRRAGRSGCAASWWTSARARRWRRASRIWQSHDALTGLPNRVLLLDRLGQALTRAARHRRAVAVLFLDLDRFKFVNDSFGHSMGDQLLKAVAQRLSSCVRTGDTAARLGGDEFVAVLEDMAHAQDATPIAQKILDQFMQPFRVEDSEAGTQNSISPPRSASASTRATAGTTTRS